MPYTTPSTIVTTQLVTASLMNNEWVENIKFLANPPAVNLTNSGTQSISSSSWTAITFDTELYDTDSMHSTVSTMSRITISTAGLYLLVGMVSYAANSSGARAAGFRKNGSGGTGPTLGGALINPSGAAVATYTTVSSVAKLAAADYVEVVAFQTSGGALNSTVADGLPMFSATWIGFG